MAEGKKFMVFQFFRWYISLTERIYGIQYQIMKHGTFDSIRIVRIAVVRIFGINAQKSN